MFRLASTNPEILFSSTFFELVDYYTHVKITTPPVNCKHIWCKIPWCFYEPNWFIKMLDPICPSRYSKKEVGFRPILEIVKSAKRSR